MGNTVNITVNIAKATKKEIQILETMFGDRISFIPMVNDRKKNAPKPVQEEVHQEEVYQEEIHQQDANKKWMSKAEYAAQFTDEERELRRNAKAYAKAEILRRVKEERNGRWFNYNTEYKPLFNKLVTEYEEAARKAAEEAAKEAAKKKTMTKKTTGKKSTGKTAKSA